MMNASPVPCCLTLAKTQAINRFLRCSATLGSIEKFAISAVACLGIVNPMLLHSAICQDMGLPFELQDHILPQDLPFINDIDLQTTHFPPTNSDHETTTADSHIPPLPPPNITRTNNSVHIHRLLDPMDLRERMRPTLRLDRQPAHRYYAR
jgi:hypothetical protein